MNLPFPNPNPIPILTRSRSRALFLQQPPSMFYGEPEQLDIKPVPNRKKEEQKLCKPWGWRHWTEWTYSLFIDLGGDGSEKSR